MDARATELLASLRNSNVSLDAKTTSLAKLKSEIKQRNVPDAAISPLFEAFRLAIASQHSSLASAGFSALGHLLKRLTLQEQHQAITLQGRVTYQLLLEKLGDHKERIRAQAAQAFTDFWPAAPADVEHHVLEVALVGKNPRAKETSMTWLAKMTSEHGLLFRAHVPALVSCLEDADGTVRETAKATVIELFQSAPPRAISDLKKQLALHNVRKSIATAIVASLGANITADPDMSSSQLQSRSDILRPASSFSHRRDDVLRPNSVLSVHSHSNADVQNTSKSDAVYQNQPRPMRNDHSRKELTLSHTTSTETLSIASPDTTDAETIEPLYVNSHREFDDIIREMLPHFEGKESEQNWILREKSIIKLRRLTKGNAFHDFQQYYLTGIKSALDGILKTANSLRTTVSAAGCHLLQDISRTCGPAIDPMVEILLQSLIKLSAALKKITAQHGNVTVDVIVGNVSYTSRILQHMWAACQDKNVQPRQFATGWIRTILTRHGKHKGTIEHSGGLDLIEKCIKKGLGDPNPGVREGMRGTFWAFYKIWPEKAEIIMSALEPKSKTLLERNPNNPHGSSASQPFNGSRSIQSHAASGKPSLKEAINAQRKAQIAASKNLPPRPESAQSTFSDAKSTRPPMRRPAVTSTSTVRVPTGEKLSQSASLSSAPMRPASRPRRPEIMRPATADPYSSRRSVHPSSQSKISSPSESPQKSKSKSTATPRARIPPPRPKSRIDNAPVSTAKDKQRPDLASHKTRHRAPSETDVVSAVDSTRTRVLSPSTTEQNFAAVSPQHGVIGNRGGAFQETLSKESDKSSPIPTYPLRTPLKGAFSPPSRNHRLSNEPSISRIPISPSYSGRKSNEESIYPRTPIRGRHSRDASGDIASQIPAPVEQPHIVGAVDSQLSNTLKVYEDPQSPSSKCSNTDNGATPQTPQTPKFQAETMPLEELPLNEPMTVPNRKHNQLPEHTALLRPSPILTSSSENSHKRWKKVENSERRRSLSPRSKDPAKAQDMIMRGLTRIRAGALDVHGYRKFQTLIKYHESISKDESRFEEILMALLAALEAPDGDKGVALSRSLDLKTQVLVTIRLLLALNREGFAAFYPRAMTAIITARKQYEMTNHIVSGLEETAEDIVSACDPPEVIDAILDLLETEEKSHECLRMVAMGSYILGGLLRRLNNKQLYLTQPELERLGRFANRNLRSTQPDVRRAIIEFCPELYDMVQSEDIFWSMVNSSVEDFRPLLTYYIMRRPAKVD
ncbi:suppressor of tub2 mutation [Emydomyces testavorans]|uniref:Suppressor of tub2 mutation n=1 Tax=Emydomyces testavorans TaxID=2070801 RepID=A0AAF0DCB2_9EURO|nr:suppressor of tub2 mutation [Emydomyces testavorans]